MRKIIIDCDPGIDDALAIFLALASPNEIEVLGLSVNLCFKYTIGDTT